MGDKNTNRLREEIELLLEQYEKNQLLIEEREMSIREIQYENKNQKERIVFLQEELVAKRSEYSEKIERIQKKNKEERENKKEKEKESQKKKERVDSIKLNKLVDLYRTASSSEIVEGIVNDYRKLTSEMDKIFYENERKTHTEEIGFVFVKHEDVLVPFRVIDEYYTFADLLWEACQYFELKTDCYRIQDHEGSNINMMLSVKSHMQTLREMLQSVPNLSLQAVKEVKEVKVNLKEEEEDNKPINEIETADLLDQIEDVEDELLSKLKKIIFYLVFLALIFVYNVSNGKVHQAFHVHRAYAKQIMEKKYFEKNQLGLENSFVSMSRLEDMMSWGFNGFVKLFDFSDFYSFEENMEPISLIMSDYIVIGQISILHTRVKKDQLVYKLKHSEHASVFNDYASFFTLSLLETPVEISGHLSDYNVESAYMVNVAPRLRELHIIVSMFRNLDLYSADLELLRFRLSAYNYNQDILITIIFTIEQNINGNLAVSHDICVIDFMRTVKNLLAFKFHQDVIVTVGFVLLITIYSLYGVYDIFMSIRKEKLKYFTQFWNVIFVFKIMIFVLCLVLRILMYFEAYHHLSWVDSNSVLDTNNVCGFIDTLQILEMLMISFTMIFFLNYLDENIVGPIFDTLYRSLKNILVFISSYVFIITGYGFFCNYFYGYTADPLKSLDRAIIQLFLMVFGDSSIIKEMAGIFLTTTSVFQFAFALTFFMLFANWLIGTIVQWYDVDRADKKFTKARTGTITTSFFDEIDLVSKKYLRSVKIFYYRIINYIKEIKNLRLKKQNEKNNKKDKNDGVEKIYDKKKGILDSDEDEEKVEISQENLDEERK